MSLSFLWMNIPPEDSGGGVNNVYGIAGGDWLNWSQTGSETAVSSGGLSNKLVCAVSS